MSRSVDFKDRRSSWCGARCNGALLDMAGTFQGQISETPLPRAAGRTANSDGGHIYVTVSDKTDTHVNVQGAYREVRQPGAMF